MKAILEFNLPEESNEFTVASKSAAMASALWDIDQKLLRNMTKYNNHPDGRELTIEEHTLTKLIRDEFHKILNEHNLEEII